MTPWTAWLALSIPVAVGTTVVIVSAFAPAYLEAGLYVWVAATLWSWAEGSVRRAIWRRWR